ncbi:sulfotransferase family 2 domain-containing protein [Primorskyibacter sp. S187A]|uniref:sulfotransferase family 2 domain-containing protein n=1 Tax=Primorskyibacter sp. S187A TaxID=3415130 RepID=UPI003C7DFC24
MTAPFDYFVVFAEMRTGSNFLEANLNLFDGISCLGEVFNPYFIAYPNRTEVLGMTQAERDRDPVSLLERIKSQFGQLAGFRYFHDHDPRILQPMLDDPRCAKIVLTRNPIDSYVSWKIAQATDQWKLTDVAKRKDAKARFDAKEFETHVAALQTFQITLLNALQTRGQTPFYVGYDDLNSLDVMNGLALWLGIDAHLYSLDSKMKRQNPAPLSQKVENFDAMEQALSRFDRFDLTRTPNFEPRRGPVVPGYVAAAKASVMYMPIRSGPEKAVCAWLASLDETGVAALLSDFNQKTLRQWMRAHPGHRRFCVLRHPVLRAHTAFCDKILNTGQGSYKQLRRKLVNRFGVNLPDEQCDMSGYDADAHRTAFKSFLAFLQQNLNGQTAIRVDAHWCTQTAALQGMADFATPDVVLRETELEQALPALAQAAGCERHVPFMAAQDVAPYTLTDIYDEEIEALTRAAYQRDYISFGFRDFA